MPRAKGLRPWVRNRRDLCYVMGRRMNRLNIAGAASAWSHLAQFIEGFGDPASDKYLHSPKFHDLIAAMRTANVRAHQAARAINAVGVFTDDGTILRHPSELDVYPADYQI